MVRPLDLFLRSSVWTRTTSIQSYRFFVASASMVLALFSLCGISLSQHCAGTCPTDTSCIGDTCRPSYSGIPCSTDSACPSSGPCVGGHCVKKLQPPKKLGYSGKPCSDLACPSGTCSAGQCVKKLLQPPRKLPSGRSCLLDSQCSSGKCFLEKCAPPLADGSSCVFGSQCDSGTCSLGKYVSVK